jgi:uncharacterized membrane protein YdbT with pleckstrin-like domain
MSDAYLSSLLGDREQILLVTRRHWFVLLQEILAEIVLLLITLALITVLYVASPEIPGVALAYLVILFPFISLTRDVVIWNSHKYVVTNLRVIQIMGVFNKNVTDSSLEKVNDVKMEQSVLGRIFGFGDIEVLTASELGINRFTMIGKPVNFKTAMLNAKIRLEELQNTPIITAAAAPATDIATLIGRLGELRERGLLTDEEFNAKKAKLLSD